MVVDDQYADLAHPCRSILSPRRPPKTKQFRIQHAGHWRLQHHLCDDKGPYFRGRQRSPNSGMWARGHQRHDVVMKHIRLGRSDLQVSRIAFGTWQLGGDWGTFDEETAITAIQHARELGVNFFDTAQAYGFGKSEALLGRALRDELKRDRESLVIATKGGINPGSERARDAGRAWLRQGVEESLRYLDLDYIDLYQVHWPDADTPAEETANALQELVDEGKIRHVGVSNYNTEQLAAFDKTRPVETLQPPYHLFRRAIEEDPLPYAREHNIGVLVYSPLG